MNINNVAGFNPNPSVSGTTTYNGLVIPSAFVFAGSFQVISTGGVGTLTVQGSNDNPYPSGNAAGQLGQASAGAPPVTFVPTNWNNITGLTVSVTGSGTFLIPKTDLCYQFIRVSYVNSSGTGTIQCNIKTLSMLG